jgi:predicted phosphodiesterase
MKIKLMSDIHLEFPKSEVELTRDGADVLILAGDICTARNIEDYIPFFERAAEVFPEIIYIAGNHEHYGFNIELTMESLPRHSHLHRLDGEWCEIGGMKFWGGTLWTDLNDNDPMTALHLARGMNDYWLIANGSRVLTPHDTYEMHKEYLSKLGGFLDFNGKEPCVVVTHHTPSKKSIHPRYKVGEDARRMNGGYSSDLSELIKAHPEIKLWVHGHTHDSFDYMEGQTRVVANPAGYPVRGRDGKIYRENEKFNPGLILEV